MAGEKASSKTPDAAGTVSVVLPRALIDLFPGAPREVDIPAATVGDVVAALEARWPGMRDRLCDSTPRVRRHINVFVAGRRAGLDTTLSDGERIYILTAISGG
jgi:molybdopterin converting factor small subunit